MDRDTHAPLGASPAVQSSWCRGHGTLCAALVGVGAVACLVAIGLGYSYLANPNGYADQNANSSQAADVDLLDELENGTLFKGWNQPAFVLVLSGEMHGYLQPCGCSDPQLGGLVRRYNLIQAMRKRGWPIVAADLGDINLSWQYVLGKSSTTEGPLRVRNDQQVLLKYKYAMLGLDIMGYSAVSFGAYEMSMSLQDVLGHYSLNNPSPRVVSANLLGRQPNQAFDGTVFASALVDKPLAPKIGIFGLMGPEVEAKVNNPVVKFDVNTPQILLDTLRDLKAKKAELTVLLYQGSKEMAAKCAKHCAEQVSKDASLARLDVILCLSDEPDPPAMPIIGPGGTMIVQLGHKGKYVGAVGAFRRNGQPGFDLKYQLVSIEKKLETPKGQEMGNKLMQLMEELAKEVKDGNYLGMVKQTQHHVQVLFPNSAYVGSDKCQNCHPHAYKIWQASAHAHAYDTLVKAKNPGLRQFDGECIVCHTVGFGKKTGFEDMNKTKFLTDVGCESCHGPGSEHLRKPNDKKFQLAINPDKFRGAAPEGQAAHNKRMLDIGDKCMKCHDSENDVHFTFNVNWPKVMHMNPGNAAVPANATPKVEPAKK